MFSLSIISNPPETVQKPKFKIGSPVSIAFPSLLAVTQVHTYLETELKVVPGTQLSLPLKPLSTGNMFQDLQWIPETVDSTKPYIYYGFATHAYL